MYKTVFNKRESLKFTHFSRKRYALFACLGREVLIGTLSVATLTYAKADGVSVRTDMAGTGMADSTRTVMLDEVDVTASRAPLAAGRAPRIVTVLGREEIAAAPAQSVNDLLKYAAGVDVRQRGAIGAQTDIGIRGGTSEHIAYRMTSLLPEPFGAGTRKNYDKRNYVLNNIQDIEYRTMSFIDNSDAKRFESYIKFAENYLFNT